MRKILALAALLAFAGSADAASFPFKGTDGNTYTGYAAGPVAGLFAHQVPVTASATAMPANALVNGVVIFARTSNTGPVFIGSSSSITTIYDGTGATYVLMPGASVGLSVTNTSSIFIIGTAGDVVSWLGN